MLMKAKLNWNGGMAFSGETESGHHVLLDAGEENGGANKGPRPTEVLLNAAAVCTGMDIVMILEKMRFTIDGFHIEIDGTRAENHPRRFTEIAITYHIDGELPEDKVVRAIKLSRDTYCTVVNSLNAGIQYHYVLNEEESKTIH